MNPQNAPEHPILSISSSKSSKFVTYAQYKPADINEQRSILVYSNNKYQVLIGGMQVYFIFLYFCFFVFVLITATEVIFYVFYAFV